MHPTKQQIREAVSARRKALDSDWVKNTSAEIVENIQHLPAFRAAGTVALYMSFGKEVQLDELFPVCWTAGKRTCIPVYNDLLKHYEMAEITPDTEFHIGHYGIREPRSPTLIPLQEIDLIVIPGLAFDAQGNRLGRGGGFYDRMLSGFKGARIAVAFDVQILDRIPVDELDQPVHAVVSEIKVLNVPNEH